MHRASGRLIGQFVKILSLVGGSLGIGFYYAWQLSLVITACVPLLAIGNYFGMVFNKGFGEGTRKAYEKSGVVAAEAIENARTVLALCLEGRFMEKFAVEIQEPSKASKRTAVMGGLGFGYGEAIQYLVNALAFWYGGKLVANGDCTAEGMLMTATAVINMGMIMGDTLHIFPDFQQALVSFFLFSLILVFLTQFFSFSFQYNSQGSAEAYYELMVQEPEITGKVVGTVPDKCSGQITFQNVRFSYPIRPDVEILKGFNISVNPGQTLALVGHSGCGKSTTIGILER